MKKFIAILLLVMAVLLLGVWGFFAYRQQVSYAVSVHKRSASVVKINIDRLACDIAWNALWNPSYYREHRGDSTVSFMQEADAMGFSVPANLFLYSLEGVPGALFGTLAIKDTAAAQAFLSRRFNASVSDVYGGCTMLISNHLAACFNGQQMAFAVFVRPGGPAVTESMPFLLDMLEGRDMVLLTESRFKGWSKQNGHICAMGKAPVRIDFENGEIAFSIGRNHKPASSSQSGNAQDGMTGILNLPRDALSLLPRDRLLPGGYQLSRDSLAGLIHGGLRLEWKGAVRQQDSVITFDYDEDFNPVETVQEIERNVPEWYGVVRADAVRLNAYLAAAGVVDTFSGRINPQIFPFFGIYGRPYGEDEYFFGTHLGQAEQVYPVVDTTNVSLYLNLDEVLEQGVLPRTLENYLLPFSSVGADGNADADAGFSLQGKIILNNKAINSLTQLAWLF